MIITIAVGAFICTFLGGLFALRFRDKLHLVLGFSAGAVIAVAFFDLIPEALELSEGFFTAPEILSFVALGFVIYLLFDRIIFLHGSHDHVDVHDGLEHSNQSLNRGILSAGSLAFHSFLDGIAIGLAFQVSTAVGAAVAVAILIHDFSDGINTVGVIFKNNGKNNLAFGWLVVDALAPILGVLSTFLFVLPSQILGIVLAIFSGFFLYIGASDLIPESHHSHPKFLTTFMTILGVLVLYTAIRLATF